MKVGIIMASHDVCEVTCIHHDKVAHVQQELNEEKINTVSRLFKALSDQTRLKIAYALVIEEELCVCDVANVVSASVATASHHLRHLRKLGLAKYRKEGKLAFYSLTNKEMEKLIVLAFNQQMEGP